jgi:phospholipid/cholesterol/gamma-HCH transport system substrate-binding protein
VEDGTVARVAANIEETSEDARSIADRVEKMISAGDVDELVANLSETAHQMAEFGMQIRELTEKGIEPRLAQLNRVFQNFERFSAALAKFADEEMPNATAIMANVKTFSDQLVQLVTQGQLQLEQAMASVQGTLGQAQESLRKLDETLENVRVITEGVREGKGTVGRLLTDDKLINTVEEVLDDTKGFVKSYSLMQTEIDASTAFFPGRGAFKNTLSVRFRPNPDKYYLFQVVDDPWGTTTERFIWTETSAPPPEGPTEWKRVEETTHALKVSLQFAQNWYFLTGRFGLMENTGGLGLDFRFFEDRFQFQFDLFDFALDSNPRLRSLVQFEVVRHFYLEGGADDLLNQEYRDWFLAVGVRFTDEDLKTLLFAAPSVNP